MRSAPSTPPQVRSRFLEPPWLQGQTNEKRGSWLELLYDVLSAGSMVALCDAVSKMTAMDGLAEFGLAFVAMWIGWTGFTFYQNRFASDDLVHRTVVVVKLFAMAIIGLSASRVFAGDTRGFSLGCCLLQLALLAFYERTFRHVPEARKLSGYYAVRYAIGAAFWLGSAFTPGRWTITLWVIGLGLGMSSPFNRRSRELSLERPPDPSHMAERYGVLTLLVLGESFMRVVSALGAQSERHAIVFAAVMLILVFSLWWLYFDDVAGSNIRGGTAAGYVWVYSHLPLLLGLELAMAGVLRLARLDADAFAPDHARWLVGGGLALALFAMGLIDSVTARRYAELGDRARVNARTASAFFTLILVPIGSSMTPAGFLALACVPCVAQVFFDLVMAPTVGMGALDSVIPTIEVMRRRLSGDDKTSPKPRPGDAVRRGAPNELKTDFYSFFMEGTWSRLVLSFVFAYLAINTAFAGFYLLEPGSVGGAHPGSFADAFFFSVQTFSTIGFGVLTPTGMYGNMVVTAEAAVGLLSAAFATGLMFAKAARPRSSTMFSNVMVLTTRNGIPSLVFRAGNARGNDVVDATVTVTALKEDLTAEGHHMRRLHDLALMRSRTPLFTMTWIIIHEIDEKSPLFGLNWSDPKDLIGLIVTMTGHDGTYGQTTYARHIYSAEDVRIGHRFVDVMGQLDDGRFVVDYAKFHDTVLDDGSTASLPPVPSSKSD